MQSAARSRKVGGQQSSSGYTSHYDLGADGNWHLTDGSGGTSGRGSDNWSYSGSGSYTYYPPSFEYVATVNGTVAESGSSGSSFQFSTSAIQDSNGVWTETGGSKTESTSGGSSFSYSGSGTYSYDDGYGNAGNFSELEVGSGSSAFSSASNYQRQNGNWVFTGSTSSSGGSSQRDCNWQGDWVGDYMGWYEDSGNDSTTQHSHRDFNQQTTTIPDQQGNPVTTSSGFDNTFASGTADYSDVRKYYDASGNVSSSSGDISHDQYKYLDDSSNPPPSNAVSGSLHDWDTAPGCPYDNRASYDTTVSNPGFYYSYGPPETPYYGGGGLAYLNPTAGSPAGGYNGYGPEGDPVGSFYTGQPEGDPVGGFYAGQPPSDYGFGGHPLTVTVDATAVHVPVTVVLAAPSCQLGSALSGGTPSLDPNSTVAAAHDAAIASLYGGDISDGADSAVPPTLDSVNNVQLAPGSGLSSSQASDLSVQSADSTDVQSNGDLVPTKWDVHDVSLLLAASDKDVAQFWHDHQGFVSRSGPGILWGQKGPSANYTMETEPGGPDD